MRWYWQVTVINCMATSNWKLLEIDLAICLNACYLISSLYHSAIHLYYSYLLHEKGIMRAVDLSKGLMYVLTPVPPKILDKVNVLLVQGSHPIPMDLLQVTFPKFIQYTFYYFIDPYCFLILWNCLVLVAVNCLHCITLSCCSFCK